MHAHGALAVNEQSCVTCCSVSDSSSLGKIILTFYFVLLAVLFKQLDSKTQPDPPPATQAHLELKKFKFGLCCVKAERTVASGVFLR